jgi:hypothetical protein
MGWRPAVAVTVVCIPVLLSGGVSGVAATAAVAPVHGLTAVAVNGPGVTVSWRWPSTATVTRAAVRYAFGRRAPRTASAGDSAGVAPRSRHSVTVYGLVPTSRYSFAVFAKGHGQTANAVTITIRTGEVPTITSTSMPAGTVGTAYSAQLTVAHGTSGSWAVQSGALPPGLSLHGSTITGTPMTAGTSSFVLRYADARGAVSYAGESITVNDAVQPTPSPTPTPTASATP